jgi:hypothetical protein
MKLIKLLSILLLTCHLFADDSFSDVRELIYAEGFKYQDAYSGPVEKFISVNSLNKTFPNRTNISKESVRKIIQEDLQYLNSDKVLINKCASQLKTKNSEAGFIVNHNIFFNHNSLIANFVFSFDGEVRKCKEDIKNCKRGSFSVIRKYRCALEFSSNRHKLYELYYTKEFFSPIECNKMGEEIFKLEAKNILIETYRPFWNPNSCALNILRLR